MKNTMNPLQMMSPSATDPRAGYSDWHTNALTVRRNWMELLGFSPDEIEENCIEGTVCDLDEEIAQFNAACRLSGQPE